MNLQQLIDQKLTLDIDKLSEDAELAKEVQRGLQAYGFLQGTTADGQYGPKTKQAFADFKQLTGQSNPELLGGGSAQLLLEQISHPPDPPKQTLAQKVDAVCKERGYTLLKQPGEVNIIGIEGINLDGSPNSDALDGWNDVVGLLTYNNGEPRFICLYRGTTEPGRQTTNAPPNPNGVARLQLGQQKDLWAVGLHRGYEAMSQVGQAIIVRDRNRNASRDDKETVESGNGINLHTTKTTNWRGSAGENVGGWSAGCTVLVNPNEFLNLMKLIKQSAQYKANPRARFTYTLLWRDWLK